MDPQVLREMASSRIGAESKRIGLVVTDVEGCLNLDERTYDHEALSWIRLANELARADNVVPFVTVCSGRQHAFVEAITRLMAGKLPAIFENGCGLFFPTRGLYDEYKWHPSLSLPGVASEYAVVRRVVEDICARAGARRVIGKEVLLSFHPAPPMTAEELQGIVVEGLARRGVRASVTNSASAVDIGPSGIDKGAGLKWLIEETSEEFGLDFRNVAGVGDSKGDLAFLRLVGFPAAPANATPEVKAMVAYRSPMADGLGVVDIIRACVELNLRKEGE